ncbi:unnamed protein product [Rotaria sordida]|uniref:Uncharacterized protein n=2 Tax=Rotaria sordida TaxID=392033 RepID=A0A814XGU7_9BILA|nr:unnamed protein product [Rotaria sordida]
MSADEYAKQQLIDTCEKYYCNRKHDLIMIERFRATFKPEDAIKWYTTNCFLFRLLNRALRTEDVNLLFAFRFYIIVLCKALVSEKQKLSSDTDLKLFQGQKMAVTEFECLQKRIGSFITTNGFLSTSLDADVALMFAGHGAPCQESYCIILFEIQVIERLIGDAAKNQVAMDPCNTIFDAKRLIGCKFDDAAIQSDMKYWPFNIDLLEQQALQFIVFNRQQKSIRDLTENTVESLMFIFHSVLLDILKRMPADEYAKQQLIDTCEKYYCNSKHDLIMIERFRATFKPEDAIKWYTTNCFLFRLLNRALRTEDVNLLFAFRFYIIVLCKALANEKQKLSSNTDLKLFRGQKMAVTEFESLQKRIGSFITTNGFLSTQALTLYNSVEREDDTQDMEDNLTQLVMHELMNMRDTTS